MFSSKNKKIAVIGIDGADPQIIDSLLKEGRMPTLAEIKDNGSYGELETTHVSQSPVAWSSFQTGMNPAKHGIYDFIVRNPETLALDLGLVKEKRSFSGKNVYEKRIMEKSIWHFLSEQEIASLSLFIPVTFPAEPINGIQLSGMGTPDIKGTQGVPTLYWSNEIAKEKEDCKWIPLKNEINSTLSGPSGLQVPIKFSISKKGLLVEIGRNKKFVKENEWSDWFFVDFDGIEGMFRLKVLKLSGNEIKIYVSPIIHSQRNPAVPIAQPKEIAKKLLEKTGCFKCVSFESDVNALKEKLVEENTWIEDMQYTFDQRLKATEYLAKNTEWNFFAADFFPVDRVQHLFWRYIDNKNPLHEEHEEYSRTIYETYEMVDEEINSLIKALGKDTLVFVISDHGFAPYRKNVQLNKLLAEEGFLEMKAGGSTYGDIYWGKTQAYALGFSSIYINLEGRERFGIVSEKDYESVRENIISTLKRFSFDGLKPFKDAKKSEEIYSGKLLTEMPDIIPIYKKGFRIEKSNVLGGMTDNEIIHDNLNKWSGDHIGPFQLSENKGIIFCSEPLNLKGAGIMDLAPTALDFFGIEVPQKMDGKSLLEE